MSTQSDDSCVSVAASNTEFTVFRFFMDGRQLNVASTKLVPGKSLDIHLEAPEEYNGHA